MPCLSRACSSTRGPLPVETRPESAMTSGEPLPQTVGDENRFRLSNGQEIALPPHDQFYAQLIARNRGLITEAEQERLRQSTLLIAGCGSIGGAVIEPLVRMGAEHLVLAEPDGYDYGRPSRAGLHGRVPVHEIERLQPLDFLRRVVPNAAIPYEMFAEMRRQLQGEREGFPQLVSTANLFSALALRAVLGLLAG